MGSGCKDEYSRVCLLEERRLTGKKCHVVQCGRCYDRQVCVMLKEPSGGGRTSSYCLEVHIARSYTSGYVISKASDHIFKCVPYINMLEFSTSLKRFRGKPWDLKVESRDPGGNWTRI